MKRYWAALLLALCASAPRAAVTSYAWTIDWSLSPDTSGTLSFDDLSDASSRGYLWGQVGAPLPHFITGLPPGFDASGSLSFVGGSVIELRGCDDAVAFCAEGPIVAAGYSRAVFMLSGSGSAERATFAFEGDPSGTPCAASSAASLLAPSCFAFESGVTTFRQITPTPPIPEPGTLALLLAGLGGIAFLARHRRR